MYASSTLSLARKPRISSLPRPCTPITASTILSLGLSAAAAADKAVSEAAAEAFRKSRRVTLDMAFLRWERAGESKHNPNLVQSADASQLKGWEAVTEFSYLRRPRGTEGRPMGDIGPPLR